MRCLDCSQAVSVILLPSKRAKEVARQIEGAFADVSYPRDIRLTEGSSSDAFETEQFLKNRKWQDLELNELVRNHESVFFLTPEALRYYIPAFLLSSVLNYKEANPIPDTLIFLLTPPATEDPASRIRFNARFGQFNKAQRQTIKAFLEFIRDEYGEDFPDQTGSNELSRLLRWWAANGLD